MPNVADVCQETHTAQVSENIPRETAPLQAQVGLRPVYGFIKRLFDIVCSAAGLAVLFVPMVVVAVLVRMDSQGPAIFRQQRVGRYGKEFTIYKFRTMKLTAPSEVASREFQNPEQHVTKLGAFLRKTSIDELPQLVNILRGDMSIVGYRPVCVTETKLNQLRMEYGVFALRPGITGLAQVSGRDNVTYEKKALLDARYVKECSAKMDAYCLAKTVKIVLTGEGVN